MDDYDFAVENRLAFQSKGAGDGRETFRPVVAIAGKYFSLALIDVSLDPVSVVLDFVNPPIALWGSGFQRRKLRLDKARHGLTHNATHKKTPPTRFGGRSER